MQLSLPTKKQVVKALEYAVVVYAGAFITVWVKTSDPFSKAALISALGAAAGAVYGLVKAFVTPGV